MIVRVSSCSCGKDLEGLMVCSLVWRARTAGSIACARSGRTARVTIESAVVMVLSHAVACSLASQGLGGCVVRCVGTGGRPRITVCGFWSVAEIVDVYAKRHVGSSSVRSVVVKAELIWSISTRKHHLARPSGGRRRPSASSSAWRPPGCEGSLHCSASLVSHRGLRPVLPTAPS